MLATFPVSQSLDAVGRPALARTLLGQLAQALSVEHCVLYRFGDNDLQILGVASSDGSSMAARNSARYRQDFWRGDVTYQELRGRLCGYKAAVSCLGADQMSDLRFRRELILDQGLAGRALIVAERAGGLFGISMFRSHGAGFFSLDEQTVICALSDVLVSLVAKHAEALAPQMALAQLLSSVDQLEAGFGALDRLTRRECQVCARIVYGMSMKEIARDLGITPESAVTYRKRSFLRLDVADRGALLRRLAAPAPNL